MAVQPEERAYMRRIGTYKELSAAEDHAAHVAARGPERLRRSWELYLRYAGTPFLDREATGDQPEQFYQRARELGLYRP